jgi:transposase
MTGEVFLAYVGQFLVPVLSKGDVLVLDDLPAHKVAGVRETIRATGASLLYLSLYSPHLHPIEQPFAKLKALLRKVAARAREALWANIGRLPYSIESVPQRFASLYGPRTAKRLRASTAYFLD